MRRDRLDLAGILALVGVMALLSFGQVIIKFANSGLQPVFFAGARSALAVAFVGAWLAWRGLWPRVRLADAVPGLLIGVTFSVEFLGLFLALDLTTVGRSALLFYSMPVWLGIVAHFFVPGERATPVKAVGLALAFLGTAWAVLTRSGAATGDARWIGDLCALIGAWGWTGTALATRLPAMRRMGPEAQLFWMVLVSAPILIGIAPLFGPILRDVQPIDWVWLAIHASLIATGGFIAWLWLFSVYPASTVASFSFLSPLLSILFGRLFFDEPLAPGLLGACLLVSCGIILINRPRRESA